MGLLVELVMWLSLEVRVRVRVRVRGKDENSHNIDVLVWQTPLQAC